MYRIEFGTLWEKARVGCFKRTASKHVYYLEWNRSPAQVQCMRQVLRPGALGKPRGNGWRGRWEGGLGWGTHVNTWVIHFNVWQNPLQYFKVISLQLIKKKKKKKEKKFLFETSLEVWWLRLSTSNAGESGLISWRGGSLMGFSRVAAGTWGIFSSYDGDAHSKREFV